MENFDINRDHHNWKTERWLTGGYKDNTNTNVVRVEDIYLMSKLDKEKTRVKGVKTWISNIKLEKSKFVNIKDLNSFLEEGWIKGKKYKK